MPTKGRRIGDPIVAPDTPEFRALAERLEHSTHTNVLIYTSDDHNWWLVKRDAVLMLSAFFAGGACAVIVFAAFGVLPW